MTTTNKRFDVPLETFSKVVEVIYDCALEPKRWQVTISMIAELLESQRCTLGVHDHTNWCNDLMFQVGWDDEYYWRLHEEKYSRLSPFFSSLNLLSVGEVAVQAQLVKDEEFFKTTYYQEWVKPQGLRDMIAMKALQTGQRAGILVANRVEGRPRYGDAEVRLLRLLSPHVCRAVAISDTLNLKTVKSDALEATLHALACGVYLTDRHGRIVFMNHAAERQIKTSNAIRVENNRIAPVDRAARAALARAIDETIADEAAMPAGGFTLALPEGPNAGLVATILPLTRGERQNLSGAFAAVVAIFVQDPIVVPPLPGEAFAKLYSLTGSELRVLLAMAPGLSVKETAEMLGIGEVTARTHLQHIYEKTGTSKQTELMHLFMSSTPPVRTLH
jgi:DNA-binding CsgD family transcriptional regulator/PAS domain-containing protein